MKILVFSYQVASGAAATDAGRHWILAAVVAVMLFVAVRCMVNVLEPLKAILVSAAQAMAAILLVAAAFILLLLSVVLHR